MTTLLNDLTGQTPGTTVTAANSDDFGGSAFTNVTIGSGYTLEYNATTLATGWPTMRMVTAGTVAGTYLQWPVGGASTFHLRVGFILAANPPGNWDFGQVIGTSTVVRLRLTSAGKLALVNGSTVVATSADSVPIGTPFIIEASYALSTGGSGAYSAKFYAPGASAVAGSTISATGLTSPEATGTNLRMLVPISAGSPISSTVYAGAFGFSDTAAIGPLGASVTAPDVSAAASPTSVETGETITLNGTLNSDGGETPTYAWSKQSGPGTATFASSTSLDTTCTVDTAGSYVFRLTATNGGGVDTADTSTITAVPPAPHAIFRGSALIPVYGPFSGSDFL